MADNPPTKRTHQQQVEETRRAIRVGILELAAEIGPGYILSVSRLAQRIGITRPTIYAYKDVIEETLKEVAGRRAMSKGEGAIQFMREKIMRLEEEKSALQKELQALRGHHLQIYRNLYMSSAKLAALVAPVLTKQSWELNQCILCKQPIGPETPTQKAPLLIFPTTPRRT